MHIKSFSRGLNVDLAQPGLKPGTLGSRSQVSTTIPQRGAIVPMSVEVKVIVLYLTFLCEIGNTNRTTPGMRKMISGPRQQAATHDECGG